MNITKNRKKEFNNWHVGLYKTSHFIERYIERVMSGRKIDKNDIYKNMDEILSHVQKNAIEKLKSAKEVKIPMGSYMLIISNCKLITIYN
mgnify:CR=1 FL=1